MMQSNLTFGMTNFQLVVLLHTQHICRYSHLPSIFIPFLPLSIPHHRPIIQQWQQIKEET